MPYFIGIFKWGLRLPFEGLNLGSSLENLGKENYPLYSPFLFFGTTWKNFFLSQETGTFLRVGDPDFGLAC